MKDISFGQGVGCQGEGHGEDEVLGGAEQSGGAVLGLRLACKEQISRLRNRFQIPGFEASNQLGVSSTVLFIRGSLAVKYQQGVRQ